MSRAGTLVGVLLLLAGPGCGGAAPIPAHDAWIGVEVGAEPVVTGKGFPLTVTRVWRKDRAAAAWDDAGLAPLVVRLLELSREEDDAQVRETRRFRAWAFAREDVVVPPVAFATRRAGGEADVVHAPAIRLRVRPALLPGEAGPPELPGGPLADPPARGPWIALGLALLVGVGLVAVRRRGPRVVEAPPDEAPPPPAPEGIALAALERLRAGGGRLVDVTQVVRDYVARRYGVRAPYRTTEEVLAAPRFDAAQRARLAILLRRADRAKFAAYEVGVTERNAHLDEAETFVRESAEGAAS